MTNARSQTAHRRLHRMGMALTLFLLLLAAFALLLVVWPVPQPRIAEAILADLQRSGQPAPGNPAGEPPIDACDRLAAPPDAGWGDGVPVADIDAGPAIQACLAAVDRHPEAARFDAWLGRAYLRAERFDEAATRFGAAAKRRIPDALYQLGLMAERGPPSGDPDQSPAGWYRQAADQGYPPAEVALARLYETGRGGVAADADAALRLYWSAATKGHPAAAFKVGWHLAQQADNPTGFLRAARFFTVARKSGNPDGAFGLSRLYRDGRGLPKDVDLASALLREAAEGGSVLAQEELAEALESGGELQGKEPEWGLREAVIWYRRAADRGAAGAAFRLGRMLLTGRGTDIDGTEGIRRMRQAADAGLADAQLSLGSALQNGAGVAANPAEALQWYRKAAEQGHPEAEAALAKSLAEGIGTHPNPTEAGRWYRKVAERGDRDAQLWLGDWYAEGKDIAQDLVEAASWYRRAAERGDAAAQRKLARLYAEGRGVERSDQSAVDWYSRAAGQHDATAQYALAELIREGRGSPPDPERAAALYAAASRTHAPAANALGVAYATAYGVGKDLAKAAELFNEAALRGFVPAGHNLGIMHLYGYGRPRDIGAALDHFLKAANAGDAVAMRTLGQLHLAGDMAPRDYGKAVRWLWNAASADDVRAKFLLGVMDEYGLGGAKNREGAAIWYGMAGTLGDPDAALRLRALEAGTGRGKDRPAKAPDATIIVKHPLPFRLG